jgi:hypothetical protein
LRGIGLALCIATLPAACLGSAVVDAANASAEIPIVPNYPLSGTISQEGRSIELGHSGGCLGGVGHTETGRPACIPELEPGFDAKNIAVVTPGSVDIHLSRPATVLEATNGVAVGTVHQDAPDEATVTFSSTLAEGKLAWAVVAYGGQSYDFYFKPENAVAIASVSCARGRAHVRVMSKAQGTLTVTVRTKRGILGRHHVHVSRAGETDMRIALTGRTRSCVAAAALATTAGTARTHAAFG